VPQRVRLTDTAIRSFTEPTTHWDSVIPGLGVRVSRGGTKSFIIFVGPGRRKVLGRYPVLSLSGARTEAKNLLAEKTLGRVAPARTPHSAASERYFEDCERSLKPRTVYDYRRTLNKHFPFGQKSVGDITAHDILTRINKLSATPAEQHYAYVVARAYFNWCLKQHLISDHPMRQMTPPKVGQSRDRVLTDEELAIVYDAAAAGDSAFHRIVQLLVLTGQRRGEIAGLQWEWIGEDTITLPAEITKNRREHTFPLTSQAKAVLDRVTPIKDNPYVFPASKRRWADREATTFNAWSKNMRAFRETVPIDFTLHDLRRTLSSGMARLGVSQIVTEKLLNHLTGSQSDIARVYNRYSYLAEMREALTLWEAHLHNLPREA
jgi:integrase